MSPALNLIVLRSADLTKARRFYEAIGLRFDTEKHGKGPEHLAAQVNGCVLEIYPQTQGLSTSGMRLGFRVPSIAPVLAALEQMGVKMSSPLAEGPWGLRAVVVDPDGHKVEFTEAV
jgi:catechol 2,3-dioxygenase-like lactoylglutathione lyase family enzyme